MNAKNLPLKFGFLAVIIAMSIVSWYVKGLKLGIDLEGGAELVYQIYTNEARQEQLAEEKAALEEQLKTAEGDKKKEIQARIDRIGPEIESLNAEDPADLSQKMIAILKRRVDPSGTQNIEWRPMGADRFAVRMPAARKESQLARADFVGALADLEARNLRPSEISSAVALPAGDQRSKAIARLAGGDKQLIDDLTVLGQTHDKIGRAKDTGDADAHRQALVRWRRDLKKFRTEHNLRTAEMQAVLQRYAAAMAVKDKKKQSKLRTEEYDKALDKLHRRYPRRSKEIDEVVKQHKRLMSVRQHLDDPADLKRLIAKAGQLEFRIAPSLPGARDDMLPLKPDQLEYHIKSLRDEGPEGGRKRSEQLQWFPANGTRDDYSDVVTSEYAGQLYMLLYTQPHNTMLQRRDWNLKNARPTTDEFNSPAVGFDFDERGAQRMATLTRTHKGHFMAVLLDDTVYSCPIIKGAISDRGIISGNFSRQQVIELVRILEAGSLPARLNPVPVSESKFGPAIGRANREMGFRAAIAGIIAVAVFMLAYYAISGFIADIALLLNLVLVLGVMSMFNVVFTLPGIAGVILTVGIAVDANVLIFERLREEQAKGQPVGMAIKNAYDRALSAIFDANITTLITCLILGWVSTEEVKGFAITLGLGVAFSLFTALVVTRWVFQLLLKMGLLKNPVFMLHVIGVPKINWMAKRKLFWGLSAVMIAGGMAALISQGKDILGIEFSAGTKARVALEDGELLAGRLPDDELIRSKFEAAAGKLGFDKLKATARVEEDIDADRAKNFIKLYGRKHEDKVLVAELPSSSGKPASSPDDLAPYFRQLVTAVDENDDGVLDYDELDDFLPALAYQITTTEDDVNKVREAVEEAFGNLLKRRRACTFDLVKGDLVSELGIHAAEDGLTRISAADSTAGAAGMLQDFDGGLMMVVTNLSAPMSRQEIEARILQMRFQDDFRDQRQNICRVVPLGAEKGGKHEGFAILVLPSDDRSQDETAWKGFATAESELLAEAMGRSEAMIATNFDPAIASDAAQSAIVAIVLSWLAIVGYLWFRFGSPQWGFAAVICLVHDVIIVVGLVAISNTIIGRVLGCAGFKIDLPMIAAILTVIGYSVNDTIVVFDRIRENRGKLSAISEQAINLSINQTLGRTLLTSSTTFLVVLIMFIWGGPGIHAFSFALLAGIIFGTYSSVAVASPLLLGFKEAILGRALPAGDS